MTREERLLRVILMLLLAMARWQFDSKDADYRTRATWFGLRDAITEADKELKHETGN